MATKKKIIPPILMSVRSIGFLPQTPILLGSLRSRTAFVPPLEQEERHLTFPSGEFYKPFHTYRTSGKLLSPELLPVPRSIPISSVYLVIDALDLRSLWVSTHPNLGRAGPRDSHSPPIPQTITASQSSLHKAVNRSWSYFQGKLTSS